MGTGWRKGTEAEEEEGLQGGGQIARGEWVERGRRERDTGPELLPLLPFDSSPPRERRRGAERRLEEERGGERRRRARRRRLLR